MARRQRSCFAGGHLVGAQERAPARYERERSHAAFGGTWTYHLEPINGGTQLTVTEDGYVSNPIFRVMMKAMGVHRTADGYLKALGRKVGEHVKPEHVQ